MEMVDILALGCALLAAYFGGVWSAKRQLTRSIASSLDMTELARCIDIEQLAHEQGLRVLQGVATSRNGVEAKATAIIINSPKI